MLPLLFLVAVGAWLTYSSKDRLGKIAGAVLVAGALAQIVVERMAPPGIARLCMFAWCLIYLALVIAGYLRKRADAAREPLALSTDEHEPKTVD